MVGKVIWWGVWVFVWIYVLCCGFFDGWVGFMIVVFNVEMVYYCFLKFVYDGVVEFVLCC